MLTVLVLFCVLLVLAFVVAVVTGLIAVSPILLLIICLPLIDCFVLKLIFGKKKNKCVHWVIETWPFGFRNFFKHYNRKKL